MLKTVALAKEHISPENPGAQDTRVALIPNDVAKLVAMSLEVFVETNAGLAMGFTDADYIEAGATI